MGYFICNIFKTLTHFMCGGRKNKVIENMNEQKDSVAPYVPPL